MKNQMLLLLIAASAMSFGSALKAMDSDAKGNDDIVGSALQGVGAALQAYQNPDPSRFRKAMLSVADGIYSAFDMQPPSRPPTTSSPVQPPILGIPS